MESLAQLSGDLVKVRAMWSSYQQGVPLGILGTAFGRLGGGHNLAPTGQAAGNTARLEFWAQLSGDWALVRAMRPGCRERNQSGILGTAFCRSGGGHNYAHGLPAMQAAWNSAHSFLAIGWRSELFGCQLGLFLWRFVINNGRCRFLSTIFLLYMRQ